MDDLLRDYVKGLESRRVLEGLYRRRLVRRDGDRYYLPPRPEGELVLKSIRYGDQVERDDGPPRFTQVALLHRAAGYFADTRVPERDVERASA